MTSQHLMTEQFDLHQLSHVTEEYKATVKAGLSTAIARGAASGASS